MATPLDDEEQEPGLASGLFARSGLFGQRGLGAALSQPALPAKPAPDGYATVSLYPGEGLNRFGHVGISVNGDPTYGFEPTPGIGMLPIVNRELPEWLKAATQAGNLLPGEVDMISPETKAADQVRIPITAEEAAALRKYLLNNTGPNIYNLLGRNCSTFVGDALREAGLNGPSYPFNARPSSLLQGLHKLYDNQGASQP
ncbi:MAG TPA: hypothetical protein VLG68_04790 [Gammaproteobacteria bacterium]|nr:hypothetical protein [Gammaproteobacteria bacterium]